MDATLQAQPHAYNDALDGPDVLGRLYTRRTLDSLMATLLQDVPPEPDPTAQSILCADHLRALDAGEPVPIWLGRAWERARRELVDWFVNRKLAFLLTGNPADPGTPTDEDAAGMALPRPHPETPEDRLVEFLKCWHAPIYFVDSYCSLRHPSRGTIPFRLWRWQAWLLWQIQHNKLTIVLKSRQIGASELMAATAIWDVRFRDTKTVLMISKGDPDAQALLERGAYMYAHLPRWLKCGGEGQIDSALLGAINLSTFQVIWRDSNGGQMGSIINSLPATMSTGRSRTASRVILDEWAFQMWQDAIWSAVEPTIDAGGQLIGCSTANGLGNLFADTWEASSSGKSSFVGIFLAWDRHPDRDTAWYERKVADFTAANKMHIMHQEYPRDPIEAFIQTGMPVFDSAYVSRHMQRVQAEEEAQCIPAVPETDGLTIYELPQPGHTYVIGADVAGGTADGDWDCAVVICRQTGREVAALHGRWPPEVYGDKLVALGYYYNTALLVVERNNHGWAILLRLRTIEVVGRTREGRFEMAPAPKHVYPRIYHHREPTIPGRAPEARPGWPTTQITKPLMIDALALGLREDYFMPRSRGFLTEALIYRYLEDGGMGAPKGRHDDWVMAVAIAWFAISRPDPVAHALSYVRRGEVRVKERLAEAAATARSDRERSGAVQRKAAEQQQDDTKPDKTAETPPAVGSVAWPVAVTVAPPPA